MKQFDEKFSRKAKEAFENYNADHLAEEGWNSYLRKNAKKRSRVIALPLWAKVASIAVLVTIGVLFTARINDKKAGEPVSQIAYETRSESTESALNKGDTAAESTVIANPDQIAEVTISKTGQPRQTGREKIDYKVSEPAGSLVAETVIAERSAISETAKVGGSLLAETATVEGPLLAETTVAGGSLLPETSIAAEISAGMNLPDNPVEIRLTNDADVRLKLKPKKVLPVFVDIPQEKMTTTIMTGLSGMMASVDDATSTSQGVSIGFYVEQQLTRRISVRPGLAMAKHNYGVEGASGGEIAMDYNTPELDGLSGETTSYDANIEVLSMEVPVNFVFSLRKRSGSNLFVTTGASTVIYLNQHLSGNFNNTYTRTVIDASTNEVSYESMTTSVQIDSEQEPLNRIDLLGLANFSAGYSIPFGKTSQLLFEPFVQLPLKDLTSLNMRIRYGGLSMKIQF